MVMFSKVKENVYNSGSFIFEIPVIGSILYYISYLILGILVFFYYVVSLPSTLLVRVVASKEYRAKYAKEDAERLIQYQENPDEGYPPEKEEKVNLINIILLFFFGLFIWIGIFTIGNELGIRIRSY